jgi:SAM-dependent methyltransferase
MSPPEPPTPAAWQPPSDFLQLQDGLWRSPGVSRVSYPEIGNEICFQIEDGSFWFRHRMNCLLALVRQFPPDGMLYDIGGGNGFVALGLQSAGMEVALVEPGDGARNALRRGVRHVIHATMEDARFRPHSLPAAAAFDVIEHISDHISFLRGIRERLAPGGRFYCSVPAGEALWSADDVHAGHFRRYSRASLSAALHAAGFIVEFISPFFLWLTAPIFLVRVLPSRLRLKDSISAGNPSAIQSDHRLPGLLAGIVNRADAWELGRLQARRPLPFGTSLLCVARADQP